MHRRASCPAARGSAAAAKARTKLLRPVHVDSLGHPLVERLGVGEVLLDAAATAPRLSRIVLRAAGTGSRRPRAAGCGVDAMRSMQPPGRWTLSSRSRCRSPVSTRKSMISASGTLSSGGSSVRGATSSSRSISGVANSTPRSRERWHRAALDHLAADEVVGADHAGCSSSAGSVSIVGHDRPLTYASTVPAQPILSSPSRSA